MTWSQTRRGKLEKAQAHFDASRRDQPLRSLRPDIAEPISVGQNAHLSKEAHIAMSMNEGYQCISIHIVASYHHKTSLSWKCQNILLHLPLPAAIRQAIRLTRRRSSTYLHKCTSDLLKDILERLSDVCSPPNLERCSSRLPPIAGELIQSISATHHPFLRVLDLPLNLVERGRSSPSQVMKQMPSSVECNISQVRIEMDHRARRSTDHRAVGVRASRRVDPCRRVLTFAVEEGWEDRFAESFVFLLVVGRDEGL